MWYPILIVVALIAGLIGLVVVNKQGNYETKWGAMMFIGLALFALLTVGWAGYGLYVLLF